jgi:exosortase/archaeosortase family protein
LNKAFIKYCLVFISVFVLLYGGTYAFIGITAPGGGFYNEWLSKHLNYVNWLRSTLLHGAGLITELFGFDTYVPDGNTVGIVHSARVHMVYACLGYGVLSFWIAFVVANKVSVKAKLLWGFLGVAVIMLSNMVRISILLIANHKRWPSLFKVDHHTVYSICNYIIVIALIYLFAKKVRKESNA